MGPTAAVPADQIALGSIELRDLIAQALMTNSDIGIASQRLAQARALLSAARDDMLPVVTASGSFKGTKTNRAGDPFNFSDASASVDVSYDLDLFGQRRARNRIAAARVRASEFDRQATVIAVQTDVVRAFVQRGALAERIRLLDQNIAHAAELERIIRIRVDAGAATQVELGLQSIQLRRLRAERIRLEQALDQTRTALALLAGQESPRFSIDPPPIDRMTVPEFTAIKPSQLARNRPDLRAAEARVAIAGGDVAVARTAFLPQISLSAGSLFQVAKLGDPIASTFTVGSSLFAPIFDRSRLNGELRLAAARQAESVEIYRRSLLTALAECENAMSAVSRAQAREAILIDIVTQARKTARLSRLQYIGGDADLQEVLDAEGFLIEAEDARAVAFQERIEAALDLYKAMGGV